MQFCQPVLSAMVPLAVHIVHTVPGKEIYMGQSQLTCNYKHKENLPVLLVHTVTGKAHVLLVSGEEQIKKEEVKIVFE